MLQNSPADTSETRANDAQVPRRSRRYEPKRRLRTVAALDGRTTAAKRVATLLRVWEAQLGDKLADGQRIAMERAASLVARAEDARARRLAGDTSISLWDTVRLDNSAARAVQQLGLPEERESGPGVQGRSLSSLEWSGAK